MPRRESRLFHTGEWVVECDLSLPRGVALRDHVAVDDARAAGHPQVAPGLHRSAVPEATFIRTAAAESLRHPSAASPSCNVKAPAYNALPTMEPLTPMSTRPAS